MSLGINKDRAIVSLDDVALIDPLYSVDTRQHSRLSEDTHFNVVAGHCFHDQITGSYIGDELLRAVTLQRVGESAVRSHDVGEGRGVPVKQRCNPLAVHSPEIVFNLAVGGCHLPTPLRKVSPPTDIQQQDRWLEPDDAVAVLRFYLCSGEIERETRVPKQIEMADTKQVIETRVLVG